MQLKTDRGKTYELSRAAILALQAAKNARTADDAFAGFANHVPRRDRLDVWLAVDSISVERSLSCS